MEVVVSLLLKKQYYRVMGSKRVTGLEPASVQIGNLAFCQLNYTRTIYSPNRASITLGNASPLPFNK